MNVCCALICKKHKSILLVKNRKRDWEIPGGKSDDRDCIHVNSDINLIDIMKVGHRELTEETGLEFGDRQWFVNGMCDLEKVYYSFALLNSN